MINPELLTLLQKSSIFGFLEDFLLEELAQNFILKSFIHGETIINEGELNDALYIIFSGSVQIYKQEGAIRHRITNLKRGDLFGEQSLLTGQAAKASVCAYGDVVVAKLDKDYFHSLLETHPHFKDFTKNIIANRTLQSFLKNFGSFGGLNHKESTQWIANLCYEKPYESGEIVFREGDEGDKFYIIISGTVQVIKNINGEETLLTTLSEGKFFGEMALMSHAPRAATIKSLGTTHLVSIDKERFLHLVDSNPGLSKKIHTIIDMYKATHTPKSFFVQPKEQKDDYDISQQPLQDSKEKSFPFEEATTPQGSLIACLSMIAKFYDRKLDKTRLNQRYQDEISLHHVSDIFHDFFQLNATLTSLTQKDLKRTPFPYLISYKNHYVVVTQRHSSTVKVVSPLYGFLTIPLKDFFRDCQGEAVFFEAQIQKGLHDKQINFYSFLGILYPYKRVIFEILGASIFISLLSILPPVFVKILIDDVIVHRDESMLTVLIIALVFIALLTGGLNALRTYLQIYLDNKLQVAILGRFYRHLVSLPLDFFLKKRIGDIFSDFGDGKDAEKFLVKIVLTTVVDGTMAIAFLLALMSASLTLFVVFVAFVTILGGTIFLYTYFIRQYIPRTLSRDVKTDAHMIEAIRNISAIKVFCAENGTRKRWEEMYINKLSTINKYIMINAVSSSSVTAMRTLTMAVILGYAAVLALSNEISIGQALAFNMIAMLALAPLGNIIQMYNDINSANFYVSGLNKIYSIENEGGEQNAHKPDLSVTHGIVEFQHVHYAYHSGQKNLLNNFSLVAEPGQCTAIVGKIGSGKSTLLNLLTAIVKPQKGSILIDGQNITTLNLKSLRSHIGVVFQDTNIFAGTIKSNIALAMPHATLPQIIEASILAGAHEFISQMPQGYDTVIGENGLGLSGGQKRLIAIARALVHNPPIVIMDEPTNDLDIETEQIFQENLKTIGLGRTLIIITHRPSLIRHADKIALIEEGAIIEEGTHLELIEKRGIYFYLCAKQIALA